MLGGAGGGFDGTLTGGGGGAGIVRKRDGGLACSGVGMRMDPIGGGCARRGRFCLGGNIGGTGLGMGLRPGEGDWRGGGGRGGGLMLEVGVLVAGLGVVGTLRGGGRATVNPGVPPIPTTPDPRLADEPRWLIGGSGGGTPTRVTTPET